MQQPEQDSSQRLQQDLLRQLLRDWSMRLALQVDLRLEVVLAHRVLRAAVAVVGPAASSSQVVAVQAQRAAVPRPPDSSAPERLDSYLQLPAELVPEAEAELARAKPTRTRLQRDR